MRRGRRHRAGWASVRAAGREAWRACDLPTRKTEAWKYTGLHALDRDFAAARPSAADRAELGLHDPQLDMGGCKLVFVDGFLREDLSRPEPPPGVELVRFSEADARCADAIRRHLGSAVDSERHPFARLSDAALADGIFIKVEPNAKVDTPIHLLWITTRQDVAFTVNQRLLVLAGANSSASVVEHFDCEEDGTAFSHTFTNGITELILEEGAQLHHHRLHLEQGGAMHIGGLHAQLNRDSALSSFHLALGSELKRVDVAVHHREPGAHCQLDGIYLLRGREHVDYHTCIEHAAPHCTTDEVFRGIVGDEASAVFNGRIHIHPGASKTRAELSNRNLLTSNSAEVNTKPELEIYADDVQCAHGATVSRPDPDTLHYLRTRGIPADEAEVMVSYGFINEVVDAVQAEAPAGPPARPAGAAAVPRRPTGEAPGMSGMMSFLTGGLRQNAPAFNAEAVRADFPILFQEVNGHPLVYLDNAATTQKPRRVIDAIVEYYERDNANVHRGAHALSDRATEKLEAARRTVSGFINSPAPEQTIWVRGVTEGINLVAHSWGRRHLGPGDRVLVPRLEHHSNIVPWQLVCAERGAEVVPVAVTDAGDIDLDALDGLLDGRVKMVAVNHVSNALGTVNPVETIIKKAHQAGAKVLLDGAQAVSHWPVDVQALGCDFYTLSGHKLFGPTGIGALWGREQLLEEMPPFLGGGEMIETVSFEGTTFNALPFKFEAGTPHIAGAIGLGAAVDYLAGIDRAAAAAHEAALLKRTAALAADIGGLRRIGNPRHAAGVFSFVLEGAHPSDVGLLLDQQGIAVRTGHHCAQPLMERYGVPGTVRASFSIYNTMDDVDRLMAGIRKAGSLLNQ